MVILAPISFFGWTFVKKTTFVSTKEADLVWEAPIVTAYEESLTELPIGFWREMFKLISLKRPWSRKETTNVGPGNKK